MKYRAFPLILILFVFSCGGGGDEVGGVKMDPSESFWPYSFVDNALTSDSEGADGVDFLIGPDEIFYVATGWEQSNQVRACVNSPHEPVNDFWSCVDVGKNDSVEFAKLFDINFDGAPDVISAGAGGIKIHIAPSQEEYLNPDAWETFLIPASTTEGINQPWHDIRIVDINEDGSPDIVAGGEGEVTGWFESPENPLDVEGWEFHVIADINWDMGPYIVDMDGDGDLDIIIPDRGNHRDAGVWWFENPGPLQNQKGLWGRHQILLRNDLSMIDVADINQDGSNDIIVGAAEPGTVYIALNDGSSLHWNLIEIPVAQYGGFPKDVAVGDIDLDGVNDIAVTTRFGSVYFLTQRESIYDPNWEFHLINTLGDKDDNIVLYDFDGDGDSDLMTTIEIPNLGVVIFWNPAIS